MPQNGDTNSNDKSGGILDTILESEYTQALADFNPDKLVSEFLGLLKDREREILSLRYGLGDTESHTLEAIGKKLNLTRERVRQVEKDSLDLLRKQLSDAKFGKAMGVVKKTIEDHGGAFAEQDLIDHLLIGDKDSRKRNALILMLELYDELHYAKESKDMHPAWHITGFEFRRLDDFHKELKFILEENKKPVSLDDLVSAFKKTELYQSNQKFFTDKVIENLVKITKKIESNPFGHYGLSHWRAIQPKDVGDKAYLVLQNLGKPEHYTKITELINQHKFDNRTAYKETVHNELIMDPRFVLVGRGIYALTEWGYKKGVVSDVIKEVLAQSSEPMERNKIIEEVLKRRIVKRNTILVGLANKTMFKKVGKSKYTLAD